MLAIIFVTFIVVAIAYLMAKYFLFNVIYNKTNGHPSQNYSMSPKLIDVGYRYPFTSYPTGWFFVSESKDLKAGDVTPIQCLGKDLVLVRTLEHVVHIFDAHCPHLGAHLGFGGKIVDKNCIQCPFHGWTFDTANGECVSIPYLSQNAKIPTAKLVQHAVRERNGLIFVWNNAKQGTSSNAGGADEPSYEVPEEVEIADSNSWQLIHFQWRCHVHVQDMAENAVDLGHFNIVHAFQSVPDIKHIEASGANFTIIQDTYRELLGVGDTTRLQLDYHGLGIVHSKVSSKFITLFVILTSTPVNKTECDINIFVELKRLTFGGISF